MKTYAVKEMFLTLQGEGAHAGRVSVFCRFAGCNLWTGREADRATAICRFCDTDFVGTDGIGGGRFASASDLARAVANLWPGTDGKPYVVFTGGEPLLQIDTALIDAMHTLGFEIAIETNGTLPVPAGIDWVCVSPKIGSELKVFAGDELKLVYPQEDSEPSIYLPLSFTHFWLQPMDGLEQAKNIRATVEYCLTHPQWRLSTQTHKLLGIA